MNAQAENWDDLRVFLAVAKAGSLSGAARSLGVNHSTVFRRIGAFEEALGVRLFERVPSGYLLTPAGEEMREAALRAADGVLVMETMFWPDEIRQPAFEELETSVEIRPEEVAMARSLIENLTRSFEQSEWVDTTREAVEELAAKKATYSAVLRRMLVPSPTTSSSTRRRSWRFVFWKH